MASSTVTSLSINNDESIFKKKTLKKKQITPTRSAWQTSCNHHHLSTNTLKKSNTKPIFSVRNINSLSRFVSKKKVNSSVEDWCCDHSKKREYSTPSLLIREKSIISNRSNQSKNMSSMFDSSNFKNKNCSTPNTTILSKRSFKTPTKLNKSNCITRFFRPLNTRLKQITKKRTITKIIQTKTPINKKRPFLDRVLNTITERIQAEIIKKDVLIQTDSQINSDFKEKFEIFLNNTQQLNKCKEDENNLIVRSKSDSLIQLKQNNRKTSITKTIDFIKLPRSKTDIVKKSTNDNIKQISKPRIIINSSAASYRSLRPIFSRSFKTNLLKRYDIRRHSICGLYEAEILKNIKETALMAANTTTAAAANQSMINPFKKDVTFTNNVIFKYLKSNSDSKFLDSEELFVINSKLNLNTNNNNNNDLNKLEADSSKSEFISSGKSNSGILLER